MKYAYDKIAKAKAIADEKINSLLNRPVKDFYAEIKKIVNMFDKVAYIFSNEDEKLKLIKMFEKKRRIVQSSKYSKYIQVSYEFDDKFFYVYCHVDKELFINEQRSEIMQYITIEL